MKVAFFTTLDSAPWGGSEVFWVKAAHYFKKNGVEVVCFVRNWSYPPDYISDLENDGIKVNYYSRVVRNLFEKVFEKIKRKLGYKNKIFAGLIRCKPDFVVFSQGHTYDIGFFHNQSIQGFLSKSIPYAVICHNNSDYNWIPAEPVVKNLRSFFYKAESVYFVSRRSLEMAELLLLERFANFKVFSNSLSITNQEVGMLPFPDGEKLKMAIVANLKCSHKGQNLLFHVLSQKKWKEREWELNLFGKGQDKDYLQNLCSYLELNNHINFQGFSTDIKNIWKENHILILASFGEGLPLALQEAMLFGRPALVTDVGGNSELVIDGYTGFLASGTTFQALDKALELMWTNKDRLKDLGKNAFNHILKNIDLTPEKSLLNDIKRTSSDNLC